MNNNAIIMINNNGGSGAMIIQPMHMDISMWNAADTGVTKNTFCGRVKVYRVKCQGMYKQMGIATLSRKNYCCKNKWRRNESSLLDWG